MQFESERIRYFAQLYTYELPRINRWGLRFHLAQPGIHIENGMVHFNHPYADYKAESNRPTRECLIIRYTTDGSEPTLDSDIYSGPFPISCPPHQLRAKAFYLDEESATTFYLE